MEKVTKVQDLICPACKKKTLTATIWHTNWSFTYRCSACNKIKRPFVVVIFGKEDMLTEKFLQTNIDDSWKLLTSEMRKRMND